MTREDIREEIAKRCFENCDGATQEECDALNNQYGDTEACRYCGANQVMEYLDSLGVVLDDECGSIERDAPFLSLHRHEQSEFWISG